MNQKKKQNNEVLDLLRTRPRWLIRHGISLLFGLVLLLSTGSYFVHLPDIMTADAVLLSNAEQNDSTVWRLRLPQSLHLFLSSGQSLRLQFDEPHPMDWQVAVIGITLVDNACEVLVRSATSPPVTKIIRGETPCHVELIAGSYRLGDKLFRPFGRLF